MGAARLAGRRLESLPVAVQARFMAQALGRSLAHEVGHYMLGSTGHAERGLMRESFSPDELLDSTMDLYALEDRDRAALRAQPLQSCDAETRRGEG